MAVALSNLADLQVRRGDLESAISTYREALARDRGSIGNEHPSTLRTLMALGRTLLRSGRAEEAEPLLRECLETRERTLPAADWLIGSARSGLGECLLAQKKYDEAELLLLSGYETLKNDSQCPPKELERARDRVARFYEAVGRPDGTEGEP